MEELVEKVKELINDHFMTTTLSTVDHAGNVDVAIAEGVIVTDPETIKVAGVSTRSGYENLKATKKGEILVIVPTDDPLKIESIRIAVELISIDTSGEDLETMQAFVNEKFGGFKVKDLLTLRIKEIRPGRDI